MRNLIRFSLVLLLASCTAEQPEPILIVEENNNRSFSISPPTYAPNKLVVKFRDNTPEITKQEARERHEVVTYKTCECAEESIELWTFDLGTGTLDGKLGEIVTDPDLENGEFLYYINSSLTFFNNANSDLSVQIALTKENNSGVTIAIIDSGLDYNYRGFDRPFLYNKQNDLPCEEEALTDYSGWDFVNNDNDIYDDNGHGTVITNIIYQDLTQTGIDFQILPIKAFDSDGNANYFDILCAFQYAANNPDVDIINMSFGWYLEPFVLLENFVAEASDVLIVSSAGNEGVDTDIDEYIHFPSSYPFDHMVTVAAMDAALSGLSLESNFGMNSIDLAAPGENIPFYLGGQDYLLVSGTSFSNGFVSARAAELHQEGVGPSVLKQSVISSGVDNGNLEGLIVNPVSIEN